MSAVRRLLWVVLLLLLGVSQLAQPPRSHAQGPAAVGTQQAPAVLLPHLASGARVAVLPIDGMIYGWTLESLERRVDRALAGGAEVIVIRLDTPGGVLDASLDIAKYLKNLPRATVAWVDNQAFSAGSLIATACDAVVMAPSASMGDAAPVVLAGSLPPTERAKALSPLLAELRDNAQQNGYDYAPLHAMAVLGVELYLIEDVDSGARRAVNQLDYAVLVGGQDPADVDRMATQLPANGAADDQGRPVGLPQREANPDPSRRWRPVTSIQAGGVSRSIPDGRIHDGSTLFTPTTDEARAIGLATSTVSSVGELGVALRAGSVLEVDQTWSEVLAGFAYFLTNPFARGVLLVVVMLGGYLELQSPGLGIPGGLAVIALVLLIGAPMVVGLSQWWHLALLCLGVVLVLVELLATPTFGFLGALGVLMMLVGLVFSSVPTGGGQVPVGAGSYSDRLLWSGTLTAAALVVGTAGLVAVTVYFGSIPGLNRMILGAEDAEDGGAAPAGPGGPLAESPAAAGLSPLGRRVQVGAEGVALTDLRPAGRGSFGKRPLDIASTGRFIEKGTPVRVVDVAGNRVLVEALPA